MTHSTPSREASFENSPHPRPLSLRGRGGKPACFLSPQGETWPVWLIGLLVFMAALLPRLYALGTFLTIDEFKWAEGAAQFLLALHSGELSQTYWHFFPGITISWGGALALQGLCLSAADLARCANEQVTNLADSIGWLRLSPVVLTSLGVMGVYLLGRSLVGHRTALLAALLLAFDPFFLAHSRILNGDAVAASLMFLSVLAFIQAGQRMTPLTGVDDEGGNQKRFRLPPTGFILSGALAGLALLTKLPAPLIGPFIGGLGGIALLRDWRQQGWPAARRWLWALVGWAGVAWLAFVIFWPAMWVAPVDTLRQLYVDAFEVGQMGEGHDTFYLGQISDDPGPWFYPHALAFRLTPVTMIGLLLVIIFVIYDLRFTIYDPHGRSAYVVLILLAYIIFVISLANASPKKLDRYVMAVIPPLIFLAAWGLSRITQVNWSARFLAPYSLLLKNSLLGGAIMGQLLLAFLAAPYYLTYYNPWLGGGQQAVTQVPVGWGEGLEQAAYFLNRLPKAESLTISSWYSDIFQPYSKGHKASFSDDGRSQLAADYVVFYINQLQRQKPYPGLIDYFRAQQPVFTVKIGPTGRLSSAADGLDWVEVYKAPAAQSASGAPKVEGVAQLLAYQVAGRPAAGKVTELRGGTEVAMTFFWRVLGPLPENSAFNVTLTPVQNSNSGAWGLWQPAGVKGQWQAGAVVEGPGTLTLPADMPPGDYRWRVVLQYADGSVMAEVPISAKDPMIKVN